MLFKGCCIVLEFSPSLFSRSVRNDEGVLFFSIEGKEGEKEQTEKGQEIQRRGGTFWTCADLKGLMTLCS